MLPFVRASSYVVLGDLSARHSNHLPVRDITGNVLRLKNQQCITDKAPCTPPEITARKQGYGAASESPQIAPGRIQVRSRAIPETFY